MDRFRIPPVSGGTLPPFTERIFPLLLLALVAAVLIGGLGLSTVRSPVGATPAPLAVAAPVMPEGAVLPAATHGDLNVPAGTTFVLSPATAGTSTYYQGGNITVQSTGTLIVRNMTIIFVQFVADSGDAVGRLSHIYSFNDLGTVRFINSTLTTDAGVLNPYFKLSVDVSAGATMGLAESTFAFPGSIQVDGAGTLFNATHSGITGNSAVLSANGSQAQIGDSAWAPSLSVTGGAHAILAGSSVVGLYRYNGAFGTAGMAPVDSTGANQTVSSSSGATWTAWQTPATSQALALDLSSPTITGGAVSFDYSTSTSQIAATNSISFGGSYSLPAIGFSASSNEVSVPLPATAVAAINSAGLPAFLDATGSFGPAATLTVSVGTTTSSQGVSIAAVHVLLSSAPNYNMTVSGTGSVLSAVDTVLDLNWNITPGQPVGNASTPPTWSDSNKLLVENGATAYLGNITVPTAYNQLFYQESAVLPDATSNAYFYRWLAVPLLAAGAVPIAGVAVSAFYAYDTNQLSNSTVTSLNSLASTVPEIWGYVTTLNGGHYGVSNAAGVADLLVASGSLASTNLPDGDYLGTYHVGVYLGAASGNVTQWGYGSVSPYPTQMSPALPDLAPTFVFSNYVPGISIGSVGVTVDAQTVSQVRIGENLTITSTFTNVGQASISSATAELGYVLPAPFLPKIVTGPIDLGPMASGATQTVPLTWTVNESIVGALGKINASFAIIATWDGGVAPTGGTSTELVPVTIAPSNVRVVLSPPPTGTLNFGALYAVPGTVYFNGTGQAEVILTAEAPDGSSYELGVLSSQPGPILVDIALINGMPGGTYTLVATASYNTVTATATYPDTFSVPGPGAAGPSFLDQTFLGISVLYWLLIALVIVVAVVGVLLLLRQTARGKLVECGECGQLIPENATACPKCGAEFETDLVRCSRCGSTIPARSTACPECAAQLIGKPEEAARDPERQAYNDFVERYRTESKKELGDNYSEGAFWDWWKRQPTYLPYSQWRLQQQQGTRAGMGAPPAAAQAPPAAPRRPGGGAGATSYSAPPQPTAPPMRTAGPPATGGAGVRVAPSGAAAPAAPAQAAMKPCSNCGKEIPPEYLVCPFCGAVTQ